VRGRATVAAQTRARSQLKGNIGPQTYEGGESSTRNATPITVLPKMVRNVISETFVFFPG
jgi:hypothetical protein